MKFSERTPLAWNNLTFQPRRLSVALGGVAFGVVLMFMETGFQNALLDSTVEVIRLMDGDIVIVSSARYTLTTKAKFHLSRLYRARAQAGVESAKPLYIERIAAIWHVHKKKGYPIRVLAFPLDDPIIALPEVAAAVTKLEAAHTAMIDLSSKKQYGFPRSAREVIGWQKAELAGQAMRLVGSFRLGTDFANDGNMIMSAENFERYFRNRGRGPRPLDYVDVGVLRVRPGADAQRVTTRLKKELPDDVHVFTKDAFLKKERQFWNKSTSVGVIFLVGTIMGFIVGAIICYQIIYSTNAQYVKEFATLKAMGYKPRYFISLVLRQSVYLSLIGFIPGLLVSWLMYWGLAHWTGLLMQLTLPRIGIVLLLTISMCCISGTLAMRKVLASDPADLF